MTNFVDQIKCRKVTLKQRNLISRAQCSWEGTLFIYILHIITKHVFYSDHLCYFFFSKVKLFFFIPAFGMKRVISLHTSPWYSCHGWLGREITKFLVYITQMSCCLSHLHWLWFFVSLAFWGDSLLTVNCIPFQFYFLSIYVNDALFFFFSFFFLFFFTPKELFGEMFCLAVYSIFGV